MHATSPLHKRATLWECAVDSICVTWNTTPAHTHTHTHTQTHAHIAVAFFFLYSPPNPSEVSSQILPLSTHM